MKREPRVQVLPMADFDGLSFEEKLEYLDRQLAKLLGDAWRLRQSAARDLFVHPAPPTLQ